jgi:glycosidase
MKRILLLTAVVALIGACKTSTKESRAISVESHIRGLATPVQLLSDTTEIRLRDYFTDLNGVQEVRMGAQKLTWDTVSGIIRFSEKVYLPIANLQVTKQGVRHDIPVFASSKVQFVYTYSPPGNPDIKEVAIAGNMNGWNPAASKCIKNQNGTWTYSWWLNPGVYQYQVVLDGVWQLDKFNPHQMPNGQGGFNSTFSVGEPDRKAAFIFTKTTDNKTIKVGSDLPLLKTHAYWNNQLIESKWDGQELTIEIPDQADQVDRSHIRVFACDSVLRSNDLLIPLQKGEVISQANEVNRYDYHRNIMYFMMVDRFVDALSTNNFPTLNDSILPKANNYGGDLSGVTSKIEDSYLKKLGINTIWISPITKNAEGAWGLWTKGVSSKFSAYHGYWPTGLRQVDRRFGNSDDLKGLLDAAHQKDMNVVLDFVAHHVHKEHPLFQQHPEWVTPLYLPDGTLNTERWDEHRLTTWFDMFLPTWDFARPEVRDALADSALFWLKEYDLDGFRHDATKHVPEEFWRKLTSRVKSEINRPIYQIGETYGNPELIGSYVNSGQMDAQFDFNLYDAAVDAFANESSGFRNLKRVLEESLKYYGAHHLMGNITGNQDRARFASYADGSVLFSEDAKLAGWTRDIQHANDKGFRRMEALMAFIMTVPGVPCIYYGDEIAMPGGNDPDNRRMMIFEGLSDNEQKTKEITSKLTALRAQHLALLFGDTYVLKADKNDLVYLRKYFDDVVVTWFHKGGSMESSVEIPGFISLPQLHPQFGNQVSVKGNVLTIRFEGEGFEVITKQ